MRTLFSLQKLYSSLTVSFLVLTSCAQHFTPQFSSALKSQPSTLESTYCANTVAYLTGVMVTGKGQFNVRESTPRGLLGEVSGGPIRYAEVQFTNQQGKVVQCAETDESGRFSAVLPPGQNLTAHINARASNAHVNVSVLDVPDQNQVYALTRNFVTGPKSGASVDLGTLTASAKGDIVGGAFNIMFNVLRANEALRFHLCGNIHKACTAFAVAPKVTVYWKAGVNPYGYYYGDGADSGISFYAPGTDKLYILGGVNGDTDNSDTDQFDDAVISHEYGHFIEDHYAKTDSPGGAHDGNHIIDPRLAWGEGWADFFSAFVRNDKTYRDTYGNADGSTGCYFDYDVDLNANFGEKLDLPRNDGEGNFREFAIARSLFDILDPVPNPYGRAPAGVNGGLSDDDVSDNVTLPFTSFWTTFHDSLPAEDFHFRNVGLFLSQASTVAHEAETILDFQKLQPSLRDYAQALPLTSSSACRGRSLAIAANDPETCSIGDQLVCKRGNLDTCCSNQFSSNRFYDLDVSAATKKILLKRVSGDAQLDLYLYREDYIFGDPSTIAAQNITPLAPQNPTEANSKTVDLTGLPEGHYLLNVNVFTAAGNPAPSEFQLFINSTENQVCP